VNIGKGGENVGKKSPERMFVEEDVRPAWFEREKSREGPPSPNSVKRELGNRLFTQKDKWGISNGLGTSREEEEGKELEKKTGEERTIEGEMIESLEQKREGMKRIREKVASCSEGGRALDLHHLL